jgi:transcriptional regulator with XRE-family HTH domain
VAIRFKKKGPRRRTHIADWRRHRNLTQDQLAEILDTSKATISRIENGEIPYGQDFVEACADALGCEPGELIDRDPRSPPDILAQLCRRLPPSQRPVATEVLAAILRSNGAAIEPIVAPAKKGPSSSDFAPKTQRSRSIKGG